MNERNIEFDGRTAFGALRLPSLVESFRIHANKLQGNALSRRLMSLARRACFSVCTDPIDVEIFDSCRARLYPRSNRCEKRVFLGVNSWDAEERKFLTAAMQTAPASRPFVFIDGGANVGMYSLYVISEARRMGRKARILAVEPDPVNLSRLRFNIAASQASEIDVAPVALGGQDDVGRLLSLQSNRGEVRLARAGEATAETIEVPIRTLPGILGDAGIDRIDVLKLDIEGVEFPVLRTLLSTAPQSLWPEAIILEVGKHDKPTEAYGLCIDAGYTQIQRTHLNAVLSRQSMNTTHFDAKSR